MTKEIIIGIIPAVFIFLIIIGVNVTPLLLFFIIISGVLFYIYTKDGFANFTKQDYRIKNTESNFDDIGGQKRAKRELKEALDFIINAKSYKKIGIRPLKGLMLVGPPGTGKTLLAKASANFTNSVFLAASGSEFVEMYVGMGAKRIRDLFNSAYKIAEREQKSSAIIFIDEIDVIGQKRESGMGNKEYDQTLNQLLTEMDGLKEHDSVQILIIAATNRVDILDPALLRPGRFDRKVIVDLPDREGRAQIIKIHAKNKPIDSEVTIEYIVSKTFGFSGAELESLLNEASILSLRDDKDTITKDHISEAIDKVLMGEKTDRKASIKELERIAYHELGHAIISEEVNPGTVDYISITPRGGALGYVRHSQQEDHYLYTREMIEKQIMIALAGSVAELEFLGSKSTGAQNDFQKAVDLSKKIINSGLSSIGIIDEKLNKKEINDEINSIIKNLEERTTLLIQKRRNVITGIFKKIMELESLDGDDLRDLISKYKQ
ncbi:ATPase [Desulfuribacillus stibiiarsenatis]|uniref:ATPase n=1 Tax=Desulfuribacillus stibiiarsenatis TaxID=1390249 RepID=A0A1E5L440_9FIRM|nr:AAA family ATPase [Desulfuribacillus stibiiarsenatis]OEH84844.1 ATPase [Desulfuribacillus stibiiarsenatis]